MSRRMFIHVFGVRCWSGPSIIVDPVSIHSSMPKLKTEDTGCTTRCFKREGDTTTLSKLAIHSSRFECKVSSDMVVMVAVPSGYKN